MIYLIKYAFQIKQKIQIWVFNMITGINESKTLTKDISCECKCKFDGRKCNSNQWWITINVDGSVKKFMYVKKMFGILANVFVKIENI